MALECKAAVLLTNTPPTHASVRSIDGGGRLVTWAVMCGCMVRSEEVNSQGLFPESRSLCAKQGILILFSAQKYIDRKMDVHLCVFCSPEMYSCSYLLQNLYKRILPYGLLLKALLHSKGHRIKTT